MNDIIERLKALWKRFRFWLIVLLGGFTEQTVVKRVITYHTLPVGLLPIRAQVEVHGFGLRFEPGESLETDVKKRLCNCFAEKLLNSKALNTKCYFDISHIEKIYEAEIYVASSEEFYRMRQPDVEQIEEVRHAE